MRHINPKGNEIGLKLSVIVGGMDMLKQAVELSQKPHIIVATPGRLVDHIQSSSNAIHFKRIKFLVLDEADRLLDKGFEQDLKAILDLLPKKRQTLLLSATMSPSMKELKFRPDETPFIYAIKETYRYNMELIDRFETVEKLKQEYIFIPSTVREAYLCYLLKNHFESKTCIIFVSKPKGCELIRLMIKAFDLKSTCLHSSMSQNDRIGSLAKFKSGIVPILISTDVGSR